VVEVAGPVDGDNRSDAVGVGHGCVLKVYASQ
jgi:hypothetical protein